MARPSTPPEIFSGEHDEPCQHNKNDSRADCGKAIKDLANDRVQGAMSAIGKIAVHLLHIARLRFDVALGIPCTRPPWGALTGIDLVTGDHLWQVPLGTSKDLAPFLLLG